MLLQDIKEGIITAVKKGEKTKAETYRFLLAAIRNKAIDKYGNSGEDAMTDEDILDVIRKQVKSRREAIEAYDQAGRLELSKKENEELEILNTFLPQGLSDEDIEKIVRETLQTQKDLPFGPLMGQVMSKIKGRADGAKVSAVLRRILSS